MNELGDLGLDVAIRAMLRRREAGVAPPGIEAAIAAGVRSTRQARGLVDRLAGSVRLANVYQDTDASATNRRSVAMAVLLAAALLLAGLAGMAAYIASRLTLPRPLGDAPGLLAYSKYDTLYAYDPRTGRQVVVVTEPYLHIESWSWSSDGRWIDLGRWGWFAPDGSGVWLPPSQAPAVMAGASSPDGSRSASVVRSTIEIRNAATGGGVENVVSFPATVDAVIGAPAWSTDSRWLALSACSGKGCPGSTATGWSLWIVAVDGSSSRQLTTATAAIAEPTWSDDGTAIAYWTGPCSLDWQEEPGSVDGCDGATAYVASVPGGDLRPLVSNGMSAAWPTWTSNDRLVLFVRPPGEPAWRPAAVDRDGSGLIVYQPPTRSSPSPLAMPPESPRYPSADRSVVAFTRSVQAESWGYRMDLWVSLPDGSDARLVAAGIDNFAFQPVVPAVDGQRSVAPSGG